MTFEKPSNAERSLIEKSSSWKLPPNVYRLKDHFEEVGKKQMGNLGPYQCFTVERDATTVKNHYAPKALKDVSEIFYDFSSGMDEMMLKSCNRYKSKFLRSERFEKTKKQNGPTSTTYYPQNYVMKPTKNLKSKASTKKVIFYYPQTTVPVKEMLFNIESFSRPAPGRYEPHDVTCKCYLTEVHKKCPARVLGDGHKHVFESTAFRLVQPVKIKKKSQPVEHPVDDNVVEYSRPPRQPISFRVQRSLSSDDLQVQERIIRFNTMVTKKNKFSVKTGRPVAFLAAMPRFQEASEVSIHIDKERAKMKAIEEAEKPQRKQITKKRLEELATPKNPLPKIISHKLNIFEPISASQKVVTMLSIMDSPSAMSGLMLIEKGEEEERNSQLFCHGSQSVK